MGDVKGIVNGRFVTRLMMDEMRDEKTILAGTTGYRTEPAYWMWDEGLRA